MLEASAGGPYITIVSGTPSTYKEQLTSRSARSFARLCARAGPTISVAFTPYTGLLPICPETVYAPVQSGIPPPPARLKSQDCLLHRSGISHASHLRQRLLHLK